ncbi:hypothetical protein QOZ80_7BG0597840 [Eleusine coracana subsp. coracana]|nr:hypothetical protein QOZ80_7BG0597840 [Eleusine coracana subsp. coracana]
MARVSLALLLAFSILAGAAQAADQDPQADPSPSQPSAGWPFRRALPPLPSFPCIPGMPRLPWLPPCTNATHGGGAFPWPRPHPRPLPPMPPAPPQPAECGTPLKGMMACADYLTKSDVASPPAACCDGLKAVVKDAPICMCHVVNRDFAKLFPAPVLRLRMMMLPRACGAAMPFGTLRQCIRGPVPPMDPPKTPASP